MFNFEINKSTSRYKKIRKQNLFYYLGFLFKLLKLVLLTKVTSQQCFTYTLIVLKILTIIKSFETYFQIREDFHFFLWLTLFRIECCGWLDKLLFVEELRKWKKKIEMNKFCISRHHVQSQRDFKKRSNRK